MKLIKSLLFVLLASIGTASSAAVVINKDLSVTDTIPGLTSFATTGAEMNGLRVTALFSGGFTQTLSWATTGGDAGGVSGAGWGLSLEGNSFSEAWLFTMDQSLGQLLSFTLDASAPGQVTLFDTTFGNAVGTADSSSGTDFSFENCTGCNATALYSNVVAVGGNAPVGDIFHTLQVNFEGGTGPRTNFSFFQDADNDSRILVGFVPEPGSAPLAALALLGMGAALRRRK